ncbi:MAG: tRNA (guanosine(37)-N1)-methyltransferase TrmD [Actinomycetota bacterium]|nr:tRNA (guanosine(37)-N1)-methyltransferase TrmD [Actinomycetota bacterium]
MKIDVVTLFPAFFESPLQVSLLGKAIGSGAIEVALHDLRRWGLGKHRSVDDEPYGGGAGMVMRPEPLFAATEALRAEDSTVILLSPRGRRLDQPAVVGLSHLPHLVLLCGRYEGVDERVSEHAVDLELSIGDYVLAGGEVAALVLIETLSRLTPGVLGNADSLTRESHSDRLLEHPQYTRPADFRGWNVPEVLLSGDHSAVERWRDDEALRLTAERRPDLIE